MGVLALGVLAWAVEVAVKLGFPWRYSASYDIAGILPIPPESREVSEPKLLELVRKELESVEDDPAEVRIEGDRILVRASPEAHEKVGRLLVQLDRTKELWVTVEFRSDFGSDNFLEEIGIDVGASSTTFVPAGE